MRFVVGGYAAPGPEPICFLIKNDWNDWFKWYTLYAATMMMPDGRRIELGHVKIARRGMIEEQGSTELPPAFEALDETFFSLGQDENYYETLIQLGEDVRIAYLEALRDCAFTLDILDANMGEPVMASSLLRYIDVSRVRERFNRLANAEVALTPFSFAYDLPADRLAFTPPPVLTFSVRPKSIPATNIHVLIGRNGVGKTRCFDFLARALLGLPADDPNQAVGTLRNVVVPAVPWAPQQPIQAPDFAGLVTVSFSAFDSKGPLNPPDSSQKRYAYIGLVTDRPLGQPAQGSAPVLRVKSLHELADEFSESVMVCREGVRRQRWRKALQALEADPLFAEANVTALADDVDADIQSRARNLYRRKLSSGHAAVLMSITQLVQHVEEKSLVLVDEPEGHLHPPLLSAFIRALSELLINRNGVAIVATHSPVVLQEVPQACVWKLSRAGHEARADRPERETFGENVGVLTREVFGLEVTQTGFHKLIADAAAGRTYDEVLAMFGNQLGAEGRALARAITLLPPPQPGV